MTLLINSLWSIYVVLFLYIHFSKRALICLRPRQVGVASPIVLPLQCALGDRQCMVPVEFSLDSADAVLAKRTVSITPS